MPYGVKATTTSNRWSGAYIVSGYNNNRIYLDCPIYDKGDDEWLAESVKMYLRPMSSMTEDEKFIYYQHVHDVGRSADVIDEDDIALHIEWLNEHHFDYRGLIGRGLALEAPDGMYELK